MRVAAQRVNLSALGTTDPDGNAVSYEWFYYGEPGTLLLATGRNGAPLKMEDANKMNAWFTAPMTSKQATRHIILAVTDQGRSPITRYQRVIITVHP